MFRISNLSGCVMYKDDPLAQFIIKGGYVESVKALGSTNLPFEFFMDGINEVTLMKFLETRVVPSTRYNINEEVKKIGMSWYDPEMLIKYNYGASVEDFYWIQIDGQHHSYAEIVQGMRNNWKGFKRF